MSVFELYLISIHPDLKTTFIIFGSLLLFVILSLGAVISSETDRLKYTSNEYTKNIINKKLKQYKKYAKRMILFMVCFFVISVCIPSKEKLINIINVQCETPIKNNQELQNKYIF